MSEPTPAEHELPAAPRLGTVHLQVADLDRSVDWYGRVLGLTQVERSGTTARLSAADAGPALIALHERPGARPVVPHGRLGLYHVALLLPDRTALGAFLSHLAQLGERAGAADHDVSEALYLSDPDGLGIEVYADRPRDAWTVRPDGELHMDTRPLDAAALVRLAADRPWTGAPAGTTIGHLHLHVGDLAAAERFYHQALGFRKRVWSYPGALFLAAGGYHHHLGLNVWAAGAPPAGPDDARLLAWEIVVPDPADVEAAARRLTEGGHALEREGPVLRTTDPWGTTLRLLSAQDDGGRA
jgi:catechol 2,3-dioxygenase